VLGCGEAFSTYHNNTSYLLRTECAFDLMIDCGYQVPQNFWRQDHYNRLSCILLTHLHADHSFGLPAVLTKFWEQNRESEMTIIGPKGTKKFVNDLLNLAYPGIKKRLKYHLDLIEMGDEDRTVFHGYKILTAKTTHSVVNLLYQIQDVNSSWRLSISGDGKLTSGAIELIKSSTHHFQELYTIEDEIPTHASLKDIMSIRDSGFTGKLFISHMSENEEAQIRREVDKLRSGDDILKGRIEVCESNMSISLKGQSV
jgi:ribonuclease BN (tRNA processing enzyme)